MMGMRQLLYVSSSVASHPADLDVILEQSRHNNALDGITGMLYSDGTRFLQVLEGFEEVVTPTFERIRADPRHRAIVILSDRTVEQREFGTWAMAYRAKGESTDSFDAKLRLMLADASPSVQGTFMGLIAAREGRG